MIRPECAACPIWEKRKAYCGFEVVEGKWRGRHDGKPVGFGACEHGMSIPVAKSLVTALQGAIVKCEAGIIERNFDEEEE